MESLAELTRRVVPHPRHVAVLDAGVAPTDGLDRAALEAYRIGDPLPAGIIDAGPLLAADARRAGATVDDAALRETFILEVTSNGVSIRSGGPAGTLYAVGLLAQLLRARAERAPASGPPAGLPTGRIVDWPALTDRGYMLDVSRNRIPTGETLETLVDLLRRLRFNRLELYFEHVFAYAGHETVWRRTGGVYPEEIRRLDDRCRRNGIELVPNQNSFGHLTGWLANPRYRPLAEAPEGFLDPWGRRRTEPFSLSPVVPEVPQFLAGLYDQLLPVFQSRRFNVGLDETFDLGQGRSADRIARDTGGDTDEQAIHDATGRVYLEMLHRIHGLVTERGHRMYYWGDIVQNHPDLVTELPPDAVAVEWGYEADHDFDGRCRRLRDAGVPFLVAPGTAIWNSIGGRYPTARANIAAAVAAAVRYGGEGLLLTDWGDNGHLPPPILAWPAIVDAGALAWNPDQPLPDAARGEPADTDAPGARAPNAGAPNAGAPDADTDALMWLDREVLRHHDPTSIAVWRSVMAIDRIVDAPYLHNGSPLAAIVLTWDVPAHAASLAELSNAVIERYRRVLTDLHARLDVQSSRLAVMLRWSLRFGLYAIDVWHARSGGSTSAAQPGEDPCRTLEATAAALATGLESLWSGSYKPEGLVASRRSLDRAARSLCAQNLEE